MSGMNAEIDTILPVAFGNEQERGVLDDVHGGFEEPYLLAENLEGYMPTGVHLFNGFTKNGGLIYVGGAEDSDGIFCSTNLETATPECSTPSELVRYMRAADILLRHVAEDYAKINSAYGCEINVRLQQRVVDSWGNRKGCHDNFGILPDSMELITGVDKQLPDQFVWHLATRSFVTGAGLVRPNKLNFAQKIGGLTDVTGYGYKGTMYRTTTDNGTPRVEVRCSDSNISDWASWMRIGSSAVVLALMQTPVLDSFETPDLYLEEKTIALAGEMNSLRLDEDGQLVQRKGDPLISAIDYQERIADAGMDVLPNYVDDFPDEYFMIARELKQYCEDMRKVLGGEADLRLLADRADWAAKMCDVQARIERDQCRGERRWMRDIKSQARDLMYDYYGISAVDGVLQRPAVGTGYKLRDKDVFRKTVPEMDVVAAYHKPPRHTRAHARTKLLQSYHIASVDWHRVEVNSGEDGKIIIALPNVHDPRLSGHAMTQLENIKQIK